MLVWCIFKVRFADREFPAEEQMKKKNSLLTVRKKKFKLFSRFI